MNSLILQVTTATLRPLLLLFSVFLLLRGHNEAGGGFVGGLVAASAMVLQGLSRRDSGIAERSRKLIPIGLAIAILSGLPGLLLHGSFLVPFWSTFSVPLIGKLGTPLLFDVGVYFTVLGVASSVLLELLED